jgi:hypothetical protein
VNIYLEFFLKHQSQQSVMKEELLKLLKDHLRVKVETNCGYYGAPPELHVKLYLDDELISESSEYLPKADN